MRRYSVLGNCQSEPIARLLSSCCEFSEEYEYVSIKPVHTIDLDKDAHLLEKIADLDLLIYQPVLDERRFGPFVSSNIVSQLADGSVKICVPPLYYGGYFPTFEAINWLDGPLRGVHDYLILACFLNNLSVNDALGFLSSGKISEEIILSQHKGFIHGLKQRELKFGVDVRVADFIEERFRETRLFYTFNHPAPEMLRRV